jgi:HNH endonuclease
MNFAGKARAINSRWAQRGGVGRVSAADIELAYRASDGQCVFCTTPTTEIDHDLPLGRGGTNSRANIQLCCRPCNIRKARQTGAEFRGEVVGTCPAGHPQTGRNAGMRKSGRYCLRCASERWRPPYDAAKARAHRETVKGDPARLAALRASQRRYKQRMRAARQNALYST